MFELDMRSRSPLYEQLMDKIKLLIVNRVLQPDERLPTVRVLASQLNITPNTVQKAYRELEREGFIYSLPGKGNYVKPAAARDHSARIQALRRQLEDTVTEMNYLGLNNEEIILIVEHSLNKDKGGQSHD